MQITDDELKEYLKTFFQNNDQLPPISIVRNRFNIDENTACRRLKKLETEGYLQKNILNKYMFSRG